MGEEGGAERMRGAARARRAVRALPGRADARARAGDDEPRRVLGEVAGVIRPLPPGILRDELVKLASSRLGISPGARGERGPVGAAAGRTAGARRRREPAPRAPANGARQALDRREQSERAFLALCIALPELGEEKLGGRRPRRRLHLPARPASPPSACAATSSTPPSILGEDARARPSWSRRSSSAPAGSTPPRPRSSSRRLQLDLHRLDREISRRPHRRGEGAMSTLAAERQRVLDAIRHRLQ